MGITAKGAWVSVRRHFRELGVDVQTDPLRVVGVGDMSGDVFGNGMLRSRSIQLVAAFDHRHVFLDPEPDPDAAFAERARLFALPRSSWADYDSSLLSEGGGVWARDVKEVPLSPAVRARLSGTAEALSPPALIAAILSAPVDLLWFGGIGTYIKAPDESDGDVGDHANDGVRITSDAVRARVIAEGANLGVTQKARIRYSRRGGRINADFIDNAAGVATSDREVNLKILLALAIERGRLAPADRDGYLSRSEDEVADEVLRSVDHSVEALNRAALGSAADLDAYEALLETMEADGLIDRTVEVLPSADEIEVRRQAGAGLIRPELAVILCYAKSDLVNSIERSALINHPAFLDAVVPYFPVPIREAFADLIPDHRLYPQLVATDVAGEIVDQMGIVWAHETSAELGRGLDEVAAAFWVARRITGSGALWSALEVLAADLSAEAEAALHATVARAVDTLTRYYLNQPGPFDPGLTLSRDEGPITGMEPMPADPDDALSLKGAGVDEVVAARYLAAVGRALAATLYAAVGATGRPVADVVRAAEELDQIAALPALEGTVTAALAAWPPPERYTVWHTRALLDEIAAWRRSALVAALTGTTRPATDAVVEWAEARSADLAAARELASSGPRTGRDPLAVGSLALRRLQRASG
jgi:glutamate dehydrogenase